MRQGVIAAVIILATGLAVAAPPETMGLSDCCDFSDMDLDGMVNAIAKKLPEEYTQPNRKPQEVFPGLSVGPLIYGGLNNLQPYGPVLGYYRGGQKFAQVDLATTSGRLKASMPWMTCAGKNGTLEAYGRARFTVIFKVADPTLDARSNSAIGSSLVREHKPQLVSVEDLYFRLRGAGDILETASSVLGKLFPQLHQEFWLEIITWRLGNILDEIASA